MLLLWLQGCSVAPVTDTGQGPLRWPGRQHALEQLRTWQLSGRVAVSTQEDGFTATLVWKQDAGGAYELSLIAPFSQGTVRLDGDASGVMMRTSDSGAATYAPDAESILWQQFGWQVPVAALRYWVRGIPAPGAEAQIELDGEGRLSGLMQSGWQVRFLRYGQVAQWQLPEKIFLEQGPVSVRIVIQDWRPGPQLEGG